MRKRTRWIHPCLETHLLHANLVPVIIVFLMEPHMPSMLLQHTSIGGWGALDHPEQAYPPGPLNIFSLKILQTRVEGPSDHLLKAYCDSSAKTMNVIGYQLQSVTMATDMYHSSCRMHPLAEMEPSTVSSPELKWKPLLRLMPDPLSRENMEPGWIDGQADRRWQTEWKEQKCWRKERRGEKGRDQRG